MEIWAEPYSKVVIGGLFLKRGSDEAIQYSGADRFGFTATVESVIMLPCP